MSNISQSKFPVIVHVYDLHPANQYVYGMGIGAYHSGVVVGDWEYTFGGADDEDVDPETTGVMRHQPKEISNAIFRQEIEISQSIVTMSEFQTILREISMEYTVGRYSLILCNCNHFGYDLVYRLTGKEVPSWINRAAYFGSFFSACLPSKMFSNSAVTGDSGNGGGSSSSSTTGRLLFPPTVKPFQGQGNRLSEPPPSGMMEYGSGSQNPKNDAEVRRQLALKAATERLQKSEQ